MPRTRIPQNGKPLFSKEDHSPIIPIRMSSRKNDTPTFLDLCPTALSLLPISKEKQTSLRKIVTAGVLLASVVQNVQNWNNKRNRHKTYTMYVEYDSMEARWLETFVREECTLINDASTERETVWSHKSFRFNNNYKSVQRISRYDIKDDPSLFYLRPLNYQKFLWNSLAFVFSIENQDNNKIVLKVTHTGPNGLPIQQLFHAVADYGVNIEKENCAKGVYVMDAFGEWTRAKDLSARKLPVLPKGVIEEIEKDLLRFYTSREWYTATGVPYRRGVMFYGIPGSGKTTAALALAAKLDKHVHIVPMEGVSDKQLQQAFNSVEDGDILLLEDIDLSAVTKERDTQKQDVSDLFNLRTLLNLLDGALSSDDKVIIATTNCIDKIDKTILRPGRFDVSYEFTFANKDQIYELAQRFGRSDIAEKLATEWETEKIGMAEVQQRLMRL